MSLPPRSIPGKTRGSALLAALCFATVLALALGSYAALCYLTLKTSNRAALSARSIELAESGLEDALWGLNNNSAAANWTATGWDPPASGNETKLLTGFSYENGVTGQIKLTITNYTGTPGTPTTITATGIATSNDGSISRALQCTALPAPLFSNAVAATTGAVVFNSSGVKADSYNSSIGDYDPVNSPSNIGYSAVIASGSTSVLTPSVQLNDAQISGYVVSSAGVQPDTTSATVKGKTAYGNPVDPGQIMSLPSSYPSLPSSYPTLFAEPASPITGYDSLPVSPMGDPTGAAQTTYRVSTFSMAGTDSYNVVGPVTLFVDGDLSIADNAKITLSGKGSLAIHVGGNLAIDGGGIDNQTLDAQTLGRKPKNLAIFDSTPSKTVEIGTTTPLYGVVYTPNSDLVVNNLPKMFGSIVANSVTFNSATEIHYDLALRSPTTYPGDAAFAGIVAPYTVTSWVEITPP
jgi:hypothetical protein